MASSKSKSSATPKDRPHTAAPKERPPAAQVAQENYKREFGTSEPEAALPRADAEINPGEPLGGRVTPRKQNRSDDRLVAAPADETPTNAKKED